MFDWVGRVVVFGAFAVGFFWLADKAFFAFMFGLLSGDLWARALLGVFKLVVYMVLFAGVEWLIKRWRSAKN